MLLNKLYNNETGRVNFDVFNSDRAFTPYLENLNTQGFHSCWHNEGAAINHMKKVHDEMCKLCDKYNITGKERMILVVSSFLHDIGKAVTGELKEDGNWSFPNHSPKGGKMIRSIFWDEEIEIREAISFFVRNHMKPGYIMHSSNKERDILSLAYDTPFLPEITTMRNLWLIKLADYLGCDRNPDMEDETEEALDYFKALSMDLRVWDSSIHSNDKYQINSSFDLFKYFNENKSDIFPSVQYDDTEFTVYIMCGISGSGKSTFIQYNEILDRLPIVSRDLTREKLGIITDSNVKSMGTKKQENEVTKINETIIKQHFKNKQSFVVDDMNIRKEYRNKLISDIRNHNGKPVIVYIEAKSFNDVIDRRKDSMSAKVLREMRDYMVFPNPKESVEMWVFKEGKELIKFPNI